MQQESNVAKNGPMERREFLRAAGKIAAVTAMTSEAFGRNFGPEAEPVRYPEPDVVALDKRFKYKLGNSPILRLHRGTLWAEGPAWSGVGRYLLWSDIPNNEQLRWLEEDGHVARRFRFPSGNSNGNTFDFQGRQIACEHGNRRVVRYEFNGGVTVLADSHGGKPLNAPNDAVVHPDDGAVWFTDPGYGSLMNYEGHRADTGSLQPFQKEAIYRIDLRQGTIEKVADDIYKPNGLCFSPDYKKLYVADTGASHYPEAPREHQSLGPGGPEAPAKRERVRFDGARGQDRFRRRDPGRYRRQCLGQRRLGGGRLRRGTHLCPQRRPHRFDQASGDLLQRLLWGNQAQPAVHDRESVPVRGLRGDPGSPPDLK